MNDTPPLNTLEYELLEWSQAGIKEEKGRQMVQLWTDQPALRTTRARQLMAVALMGPGQNYLYEKEYLGLNENDFTPEALHQAVTLQLALAHSPQIDPHDTYRNRERKAITVHAHLLKALNADGRNAWMEHVRTRAEDPYSVWSNDLIWDKRGMETRNKAGAVFLDVSHIEAWPAWQRALILGLETISLERRWAFLQPGNESSNDVFEKQLHTQFYPALAHALVEAKLDPWEGMFDGGVDREKLKTGMEALRRSEQALATRDETTPRRERGYRP